MLHVDATPGDQKPQAKPVVSRFRKGVKIAVWSLVSVTALIIAALCCLTWYLSSDRLSEIIDREMSEYFNADIKVKNARFTFWSTFPRFMIETDSIDIFTRTLDGQPESVMKSLPANSKFLAAASRFKGGINIAKLITGQYELNDIDVDGMRLNIVAYNDSVNNYDIMPQTGEEDTRIPYFTGNVINITNPREIKAYFAATDTHAEIELDSAVMRRLDSATDYDLAIRGKLSANIGGFNLIDRFPFSLDGNVEMDFKPFGLKFSDFDIDLGSIKGDLNMSMDLEGDTKIKDFNYNLSVFNLMKLMNSIPWLRISDLSSIKADINVRATARLTEPYKFSSVELPSMEVDFNVPPGEIVYDFKGGKDYRFSHNAVKGRLMFDGRRPSDSYFEFSPIEVSTVGIKCFLSGSVHNLLDRPQVKVYLTGETDLADASRYFYQLKPHSLDGRVGLKGEMSFGLSSLTTEGIEEGLEDLRFSVEAEGDDISGRFLDKNLKVGHIQMNASSASMNTDPSRPFDMPMAVSLEAKNLGVADKESRLNCNRFTLATTLPSFLSGKSLPDDLAFNVTAGKLEYAANTGDRLEVDGLKGTTRFIAKNSGEKIYARLKADALKAGNPSAMISLEGVAVDLAYASGVKHDNVSQTPTMTEVLAAQPDARSLDFAAHTAPFIISPLPPSVVDFIETHDMALNLRSASGCLLSTTFPADNHLSDIDIYMSPDSLNIRNLGIRALSTDARLSCSASNLREFLTSKTPVPLKVNLEVELDTVNINQLARAYENGQRAMGLRPEEAPLPSATDSIALLIPRNLEALINLSAKETVYTDLHLFDLNGGVRLKDGVASIEDFDISADFGHAEFGLTYDTSDLQKMNVGANFALEDVDMVSFFSHFHTLMSMMPEMKNLQGDISLNFDGSFDFFPDMNVNMPSLTASIGVKGWNLTVHQNNFIHRLARTLLIRQKGDLRIADINISAHVGDNHLEIYPFDLELENYKLRVLGTNNFDGNLYYHIDVRKSPVPFPFGVNIEGNISKPEIRIGRAGFNKAKAERVVADVQISENVNLMKELRHYFHEFIHKAAESTMDSNQLK